LNDGESQMCQPAKMFANTRASDNLLLESWQVSSLSLSLHNWILFILHFNQTKGPQSREVEIGNLRHTFPYVIGCHLNYTESGVGNFFLWLARHLVEQNLFWLYSNGTFPVISAAQSKHRRRTGFTSPISLHCPKRRRSAAKALWTKRINFSYEPQPFIEQRKTISWVFGINSTRRKSRR